MTDLNVTTEQISLEKFFFLLYDVFAKNISDIMTEHRVCSFTQ